MTASSNVALKKLTDEVNRVKAEFSAIFEAISDGVVITDMKGKFILVNSAEARMNGFANVEEMKQNLQFYVDMYRLYELDGQPVPATEWPIAKVLRGETVSNWELKATRIDTGQEWFLSYNGQPVVDSEGKQILALIINRDITQQKQAALVMEETESKLQQLAESNIVGITYWDINGEITYANDVFLQMIGYSRQDLEQHVIRWDELTPHEFSELDMRVIKELKRVGVHAPVEKQYFRKDGSRVDVLMGGAFFKGSREQGMSFVVDVTERKRLEKLKDEFLSIASHELKTPVTTIKAYSQYLRKIMEKNGEAAYIEILRKMNSQTNRLTKLINELLDVTRITEGKMKLNLDQLDFDSFVADVVNGFQLTVKSHKLTVFGRTGKTITGDRDRLEQVISNLLANSVKYSPHASTVDLRLKAEKSQVILEIQDYGLGIPTDQQEKIFERFYRANGNGLESIPGIGLGLFISTEIINRHKGTISVTSVVGKGSTFYITLPVNYLSG